MNHKTKVILVLLIAACLPVAAVVAVMLIGSNPITIDPRTTPTITLVSNVTQPFIGETVRFEATLNPVQVGIAILFYQNGTLINTSSTDATGKAVYITAPITNTDHLTYTANCTLTP